MNDHSNDQLLGLRLEEMNVRERLLGEMRRLNLDSREVQKRCRGELGYTPPETKQVLSQLGLIVTSDKLVSPDPLIDSRLQKLKMWRREWALKSGVPAYRVLSNRVVLQVAEFAPLTLARLHEIKGIGDKTVETYGVELLELMRGQ
jgi:superfamily II DNA helicase RecQ